MRLLLLNRSLKRIFGLNRAQVTAYWRRLRDEELYDVHSSPNIFRLTNTRRMKWTRYAACMENRKGAYRVLVGKLEGKRPLGTTGRRWKNVIKMDFQ